MKNKAGITLIALIITIIIMLILVGVTINYSLNGGIITKAKEASSQMQVEADKETLMMAALGSIDNNGNINLSQMETPEGFTKIATGKYTKGDYTYTVNGTTGEVTVGDGSEEPEEVSIVGVYRSLDRASSEVDEYFEFTDGGVFRMMREDSLNSGTYSERLVGTYTVNENSNLATITVDDDGDEMVITVQIVSTKNNKGFIMMGSGKELYTTNGRVDVEGPTSQMIGTYLGENSIQVEVASEIVGEYTIGTITDGQESGFRARFIIFDNEIIYGDDDDDISFTQSGNDYILTIGENTFIKQ